MIHDPVAGPAADPVVVPFGTLTKSLLAPEYICILKLQLPASKEVVDSDRIFVVVSRASNIELHVYITLQTVVFRRDGRAPS